MKRSLAILGSTSLLALSTAFMSAQAAVIAGRVTDASGTIGLDGATIRIEETGQTVTAERGGVFRVAGLAPGTYTVQISYIGAETETITLTLTGEDSVARPNIALGEDVEVIENVLVVGQRGALNSALSKQRASDKLIAVISADAIGQLPDENVAEAARRAVGVNVLNDQGEGRFISIRGANPNFVSTTINGVRLTSPEADARQVPLDVIDSDILSAIVITKSLTPDLDGDTIGGNVEIQTLSGLDQDDMYLKFKAAGIYTDQVDEYGARLSGVYANRFAEDRLGVAASLAWQRRDFGSENVEVDGPDWVLDESVPYPEELELRDYQIRRERLSGSLNLDFQATESTMLYLHGLYSDFSDQEFRSRVENKFGDPDFDGDASSATTAVFTATEDDEYEVDRDIKDRLEEQTIFSIVGGGKYEKGAVRADWSVSYAYAEESEPDRIDAGFRGTFDSGQFAVDVSDTLRPLLAFPDAAAEAAYFDSDNYEFDGLELTNGISKDDEWAFAGNFRYDLDFLGAPGYIKTGAKVRLREKSFDLNLQVFDSFDGDDLLLTRFANTIDYDLDRIGTVPDANELRDFFVANRSSFELNAIDTALESNGANYVASEDVYAGYVMAQRNFGENTSLVFGVRVEHTEYNASGFTVLEQSFEETVAGDQTGNLAPFIPPAVSTGVLLAEDIEAEFDGTETVIEGTRVFSGDVSVDRSYTDWLPSINLRSDLSENVVARAGYYRSIARPNIEAAAPRTLVAQDEDDEVEGEFGNPNLRRQRADNFDASLEWYPKKRAVVSLGMFYKRISDFIARQQFEDITVNGITYGEALTFVNLDKAELFGVEFNLQQPLDFLPGALDGFILGLNYTYVTSEATLGDGREVSVPGQSDNVVTGTLGYEKGRFDIRLAATYRDEFVDDINAGGDGLDRIVEDHLQWDASIKYSVSDQLRVFTEVKNINNRAFVASIRPAGFGSLNSQYETYGWSAKFGLQYRY